MQLAIHNANFRIIYSCGRERLLPRIFGRTHPVFKTPLAAVLAQARQRGLGDRLRVARRGEALDLG